jgi:membrane protein required for colicin V production
LARPGEPMPGLHLTAFDVAVLLVVGLSVLVSVVRGATREVLTTASWIGAAVVAYFGFRYVRELARKTIETEWLADVGALCVSFIVPLVGFKIVDATLSDRLLSGGALGAVDRVAGLVFGLARGAVIVSAAYLGLTMVIGPEEQPAWVKEAMVLPYVREGADLLQRFVGEDVALKSKKAAEAAGERHQALRELARAAAKGLRSQ